MNPTQIEHPSRWTLINTVLALALMTSGAAFAEAEDPKLNTKSQKIAPTAFAADKPEPVLNWGMGDDKNYLIPALDILSFEFILNQYDSTRYRFQSLWLDFFFIQREPVREVGV